MIKRLLIFALFSLPCVAWVQEPSYCMAVFPDYQYQSSLGYLTRLAAVPAWISANHATYCPNMLFMASTGDDVDTSTTVQWSNYVGSFWNSLVTIGVPVGSDVGNHDYEGSPVGTTAIPANRVTTQFTSNLLTGGIQSEAAYGGAWGDAVQDPEVNYWMQVSNGSSTVGFLFLEYCPRAAAVAWGASIIAAHPSFSDWWIFSHAAVAASGSLSTTGSSGTSLCSNNNTDGVNSSTIGGGDLTWAAVKDYPNVRGIFGGHFSGGVYAAHSTVTGTYGNTVLTAYVNHQYDTGGYFTGAQTCFSLYNFTPTTSTIGVQVNTACPNYTAAGGFAWLPSGNTADGANNYSTTLQLTSSQIWYVRADGGTRYSVNETSGQCNGKYDASYASTGGTGTNQNCAFNDVRYLWADGSYTTNPAAGAPTWGWIGSGGDTYFIRDGPWRVGQSGPNNGNGFGLQGDPTASTPVPPSGTAGNPTRIVGENFASCTGTNLTAGNETQLFGGYSTGAVLDLSGTSYVTVQCLDLTDHGNCVESGTLNKCATSYPISDFAKEGIRTSNTTTNLAVSNVSLHGFVNVGWLGSTGTGTTVNNIRMIGNADGGWNADRADGLTGTGTLAITNFNISWNGCSEEYPIVDSLPYNYCTDDSTAGGAGYGDGFGTATVTSSPPWYVTFSNGIVSYNTQDGLDALHITGGGSTLTVKQVLAYSNMGNQLKEGAAGTIENSIMIANCYALQGAIPGTPSGFNSQLSDYCRASNEASLIAVSDGSTTTFAFNTIYGSGWTSGGDLGGIKCGGTCTAGTAALVYENNITLGFNTGAGGPPARYFSSVSGNVFTQTGSVYSHNLDYGTTTSCPDSGETSAICALPQLVNTTWQNYGYQNVAPSSGSSNVVGAGATISGITTDFNGVTRPSPPSMGALEYQGGGSSSNAGMSGRGGITGGGRLQ